MHLHCRKSIQATLGGEFVAVTVAATISLFVTSCDLDSVSPGALITPGEESIPDYQSQRDYLKARIDEMRLDSIKLANIVIIETTFYSQKDFDYAKGQLHSDSVAFDYWNNVRNTGKYDSLGLPSSTQILSGLKYLGARQDTIVNLWRPVASAKLAAAKARQDQQGIDFYTHLVNNLTREGGAGLASPGLIDENIAALRIDSTIVIAKQYLVSGSELALLHRVLASDLISFRQDVVALVQEGMRMKVSNYSSIPQFVWSEPGKDNLNSQDVNEGAIPDPLKGYAGYDDHATTTINELFIGSGKDDPATAVDESGIFTIDQVTYHWTTDDNEPNARKMGRLARDDLATTYWENAKTDTGSTQGEKKSAQGWIDNFVADKNLYYKFIQPFLEACKRVQIDDPKKESPEELLQMDRNILNEELRIVRERVALLEVLLLYPVSYHGMFNLDSGTRYVEAKIGESIRARSFILR